jgi:hypothetical protein
MVQAIKLNRPEFVNLLLKISSIDLDSFLTIEILKKLYTLVKFEIILLITHYLFRFI